MRTISVSTSVFARIWALRNEGEETEDVILRRVLDCDTACTGNEPSPSENMPRPSRGGFFDRRFNVHFAESSEVFRNYLGSDYRARATQGHWLLLNNGTTHGSLNELSKAIGAKSENAWLNWFILDPNGERIPVSDLRDKSQVSRRRRTSITRGQDTDTTSREVSMDDVLENDLSSAIGDGTWRDDVREALRQLGGKAPLHKIYDQVESIRKAAGRSVPRTLDATVRRTLEDHSSDSQNFRAADLFSMPEGHGAGIWALR